MTDAFHPGHASAGHATDALGTNQLGLDRHGRGANKANLISGHGRFILSREQSVREFDAIIETVRDGWRSALRRAGLSEAECERLRRAFLYEGLFYDEYPSKLRAKDDLPGDLLKR